MKLSDVLGLGKILPVDKLLDILSKSVGAFTKPYFDRRDIDTKVYEIKKLTEAKVGAMKMMTDAVRESTDGIGVINYSEGGMTIESLKENQKLLIQSLPDPSLEERTRSRTDYQETKRQHNIESVTSFAAEELKDEPPVTDEPVDEGWATRFFKYAEDITSEEMQSIWGRVLAGEIKQPNTYSLRTLEVLRNLSKREAELFTIACNLSIEHGNTTFLYKSNIKEFMRGQGLSFDNIIMLREAGLIHDGETTNLEFKQTTEGTPAIFTSNNVAVIFNKEPGSPQKQIPIYLFTQVGRQLSNLVRGVPKIDYLNDFSMYVKDVHTTAKHAFILNRDGNNLQLTTPQDFPMKPTVQG